MKSLTTIDEWKIIEEEFHPLENEIVESLCSIGNAQLGQRGNFEEFFSGHSFPGSYIAGIYYPDKTKVGWWKNGYPEYFAKVLNSVNWIGLDFWINGERLDLNTCQILSFKRTLDMRTGLLMRTCQLRTQNGATLEISTERFYSMLRKEVSSLKYQIKALSNDLEIKCKSFFDLDVHNLDSNYDERFWTDLNTEILESSILGTSKTKKTDFEICINQANTVTLNGNKKEWEKNHITPHSVHQEFNDTLQAGDVLQIIKYNSITTSRYHAQADLKSKCIENTLAAKSIGYEGLKQEHANAWAEIWNRSDIVIEGDVSAQQAIRFNIFHLNQTYDGSDERLNIGPKGFTGEKYGGSTYWDTEAYCLPFYLYTSPQRVAENLLKYRYHHLGKAIENAEKLGFDSGAALYPMVTMNGEECHNEWEITFEEIHRNGAIAYAIYDYTNHYNDNQYLIEYGIEVLVAISRFWSQRAQYSDHMDQYVILGVTGPNEYENNVDNNWYTNYLSKWCLNYTLESISKFKRDPLFQKTLARTKLQDSELDTWEQIANNMYLPFDKESQIYLQQDGFLNKDLTPVNKLSESHLPLNQKWSWDRILRSAYIKQADVLQGFYFFENDFSDDMLERHFNFYEPLTVHESSLSPCVHAIQAAKLKKHDKAYEMYLRTARLDLDNYNNDTEDGLHITSMAGTWMAIVKGFAGVRVNQGVFSINPALPAIWKSLSFPIVIDHELVVVKMDKAILEFDNKGAKDKTILVDQKPISISANSITTLDY